MYILYIIRSMERREIILIDKPKGMSSFDIIRFLRKKTGAKRGSAGWRMGHSGTLDPLATGLMIIGVDAGTKKLKELIGLPKTYEASVLLGVRTATGDLEGEILESKKVTDLDIKKAKEVVDNLKGKLLLRVPIYSAVKVKGERLYKLARAGKQVNPPEKEMEVLNVVFKRCSKLESCYVLELVLEVASGTYIRSIAEEIGRKLGFPATLSKLRRTKIGKYKIEDAVKLD